MECKIGYNIYKIRYRGDLVETKYTKIDLESRISVDCVYTLFYMEMSKDFSYGGESHDFWECVFVLKGIAGITAGETVYTLTEGQAIFHPPGEFHRLWNEGNDYLRIAIVSFSAEYFRLISDWS